MIYAIVKAHSGDLIVQMKKEEITDFIISLPMI
jgi:hypothetical protein